MKKRNLLLLILLGLFILASGLLLYIFRAPLKDLLLNQEHIKRALDNLGPWAPFAYIGLQIIQIVVFVIPGEIIQIAGGYIFGPGEGLLLALIGSALGTLLAFFLARLAGKAFTGRLLGSEQIKKFENLISSPRGQIVFFFLFLIPGLPKDILCYVGGLSLIPPLRFLLISVLGRFPALLASIFIGSSVAQNQWMLSLILLGLALCLFILGLIFQKPIQAFLEKKGLGSSKAKEKPEDPS